MRKNKKVYSISVSDIQEIVEQDLNRTLNEDELKKVMDKMSEYINWPESISFSFDALELKPKED